MSEKYVVRVKKYELNDAQIAELKLAQNSIHDAAVNRRIQALLLRAEGKTNKEIAELTGYAKKTVTKLVVQYLNGGIETYINNSVNFKHSTKKAKNELKSTQKNIPHSKPVAQSGNYETSLFSGLNLWLEQNLAYYEHGLFRLLEAILKLGSVKQACANLGMSYSRGWSLIETAEEQLGYKILRRIQGGVNGGSTEVTKEGIKLLEQYNAVFNEIKTSSEVIFAHHFN